MSEPVRFEFADVEIVDSAVPLLGDGSLDPRSFTNREFVLRVDPAVAAPTVMAWLNTGAHVEIVYRGDGSLRAIAATEAQLIDGQVGHSIAVRLNVTLSQPLTAKPYRISQPPYEIGRAVIEPELNTIVICYSIGRPLIDFGTKERANFKFVIVQEINTALRSPVRTIGLFDGWLWRSTDGSSFPTELQEHFLAHLIFDEQEIEAFDQTGPQLSVEQAVLRHMGRGHTATTRCDQQSFRNLWDWLDTDAKKPRKGWEALVTRPE